MTNGETIEGITLRKQLKEIIWKFSNKKQKEIETFVSFALSNSRIMLLEDLYKEWLITESVGIRYIDREAKYINTLNKKENG